MNLYISRNGEKSGPYTLEQAQGYLAEGVLLPDDLAWHEGLEGWISLGELTASAPGGPPPPTPAQPEPAIAAALAKAGGNMKLFIGLGAAMAVLAIAAGAWLLLAPKKEQLAGSDPKPNAPSNQNPKAKAPTGKLTEPEAAELLAREIGRWKIAGKNIPVGADAPAPEPFEDILESRWLIEGKSLVSTFAPVDNGHKVQFVGHKNFDAKEGVFTWRSKGDGIPEMIKRERYDRQTKTFRWEFTFPDGAKETGTFQIADTDKRLFKSQVTVDGAVVFRREATFARIMDDPEPPNPVIAKLTPEEAAEVMALEIGTWESKGQGQPAGGQPNPITMTKEVRWKEEGKSLEYKFSLIENGKPATYFGHQEYDAAKGVFVYRSKWGNNPETTSHEVYDITTGISRGISVPTPANGEPSTTVLNKRMSDDQLEQTLETSLNGQVLYSHQITSTRINIAPTEPTVANPEPKDPNLGQIESPEALAKRTLDALSKNDFPALSKLGAESLPKEVLMDTMVNLRYAVTEENIKHTAQRRNITEEEAKEYLKEKIQKEKSRMEGGYQEGMKQISAKRKMSFDRVIAEGKKQANIEWGKVSFVRLEGEPFEKNGIKGGDFFIVLAYQGNNFKIKLDDCMHYPKHGWFLMHGPDWGDGTDSVPPDETSEGEASHEEPAQPEPKAEAKQLTPEEISEALSLRVGTVKVTEKESGKVLETFKGTWVKKGLSTEFRNTGENKGFAIVTYDPVKNVFIENFENGASIHHSTWNPLTKTLVRRLITPKPPAGESVTMFLRKIGPNQNDIRVEFRRNGELVRKIEAIGTRIEKPAELGPSTKPEPSDDDKKPGTVLWEFKTGHEVFSSPAIGSDGTVYVGSDDYKLHAINGKSGVKLWEFKTGAVVTSSPAIGSDGTVYVGSSDHKLYAIKTDSKGLAKSPWPMRGQNPQHTGRALKTNTVSAKPKLTQKQILQFFNEVMLGEWTGVDKDTGEVVEKFTIEWHEKPKSVKANFTVFEEGKITDQQNTFITTYDPKLDLFIDKAAAKNGQPERIKHFRWNPIDLIMTAEVIKPKPEPGTDVKLNWKKIAPNIWNFNIQVFKEGEKVFSQQIIQTRKAVPVEK